MRIAKAPGGAPPGRVAAGRSLWTLQTGVLLMLGWLALDGTGNLAAGALFAALGAGVGAWLAPGDAYPWRPLRLAGFFLHFLRASLLGGIDVASRALHPRLPLEPALVVHPLSLPPGLPRTLMLSVVSLLPGTLSVAIDTDDRLHVHVLVRGADHGLADLERRVARLLSLPPPAGSGS